jgi:hypothetical protein
MPPSAWRPTTARAGAVARAIALPPFARERLARRKGQTALVYRLPKALPDGKMQLRLTPLELLDRLAALILPPRLHRQNSHGVLAPNAPWRAEVTAMADSAAQALPEAPPCPPPGGSAERAAQSVHRSFASSPPGRCCWRESTKCFRWSVRSAELRCGASPSSPARPGSPACSAPGRADPAAASLPRAGPARAGRVLQPEPDLQPLSGGADAGLRIRPDRELSW